MLSNLVTKKEDLGEFTIPCTIDVYQFERELCNPGATINLMSLSIYKQLGLGAPLPTTMRLLMADCSIKKPKGILYDMLVKVDKFIFLTDFIIFYDELDIEIPIILGWLLLATVKALVDVECSEL